MKSIGQNVHQQNFLFKLISGNLNKNIEGNKIRISNQLHIPEWYSDLVI